ncbi:MAG: sugar phosphate nucleotidyltransferase [Thaumarchaeota archaeon]|nr:sugar phosphate nucleotidyltransferase [Nitrososphaerota archaeon]
MLAVILAGGLGTRLRPLTNTTPKPMVLVNGRPFLEYELKLLAKNGISDFVLCVGYLGEVIRDYFGSGEKLGISIQYSFDGEEPLGIAGALKRAEPILQDVFIVTYGDSYLRAEYAGAMKQFLRAGKLGMMLAYENHNRYGRSDLAIKDGFVTRYDKQHQTPDMVWINYGISILRRETLKSIPSDQKYDEEQFYGELIKKNELLAFVVKDRFFEIGTGPALKEFESFISGEKIAE